MHMSIIPIAVKYKVGYLYMFLNVFFLYRSLFCIIQLDVLVKTAHGTRTVRATILNVAMTHVFV